MTTAFIPHERLLGSQKPELQASLGKRPARLSNEGRTATHTEVSTPFEGRNGKEWELSVLGTC